MIRFLTSLTGLQRRILSEAWWFLARTEQTPPPGAWKVWVFLGGRGAGKTRAGAEWVNARVRAGASRRIALVGPTLHAVREVMIDGPSGLCALGGPAPVYESARRRLLWPCGAEAHVFSSVEPQSLRGPQFDTAWADEFCAWSRPGETLDTLRLGLRLGRNPQLLVTTTPRPIAALKGLLEEPHVALSRGSTRANAAFLARGFVAAVTQKWAGTLYGRQELEGEIIEDLEGALWRRADLEARAGEASMRFDTVVIGVDPPASVGAKADACGIVAVGAGGEGLARRAVVLADASIQGLSPQGWARRVAALAQSLNAHRIVAEANNGGEMVRAVLQAAAPGTPVRLVHARYGKRARAEPIAALYEQGRVTHAVRFPALEDEMCSFGAASGGESPDRVDALVWALTDAMLDKSEPRVTAL